jgi:hypothetical protein
VRRRRLEAKARLIARECLEGSAGPTETCFLLTPFSFWLPEIFTADEKQLLKAVTSEADTLPIGRVKEEWHPDFLQPKLDELKRYDEAIRDDVRKLCLSLLEKFKKQQPMNEELEV